MELLENETLTCPNVTFFLQQPVVVGLKALAIIALSTAFKILPR